jgi:CBS domain-containing protein
LQNPMLNKSIILLARPVKSLSPSDSAARAVGLLRACGVDTLPVVENGRVIGVVSETSILNLMITAMRDDSASGTNVTIAEGLHQQTVFAHRDMTIGQVADLFSSTEENALPVIDDFGGFYGVVSRADILAFLSGALRPTNVAGMATPLGVYLTNGSIRAGAGNFGLFLSGVALGINLLLSWMIVWGVMMSAGKIMHQENAVRDMLQYGVVHGPAWLSAAQWGSPILAIVLVMLMIRLSPLSGYHAAEHMTVHALEAGEELTLDIVRGMPRVHARCGTNLLAAASVFLIIAGSLSGDLAILLGMVVVVIGWRSVGGYVQTIATTKTPSEKQLENGIQVGRELVAKFQERPAYQVYGFRRIWNSGILQSMGGLAFVVSLAQLITKMTGFAFPF